MPNDMHSDEVTELYDLIKADDKDADDDEDAGKGGEQEELFGEAGDKDADDDGKKMMRRQMKGGHAEPDGDEGKGGKGDDDGDEAAPFKYNKGYCKKYMKRYMAENPEEAREAFKGMEKMKKAMDDEVAGLPDVDSADATLVNGTGMFKAFSGFAAEVTSILKAQAERIDELTGLMSYNTAIAQAAGAVLVKAQRQVEEAGSQPLPVRGIQSAPQPMQKAADPGKTKNVLLKAAASGDDNARVLLTQFESAHGRLEFLEPADAARINHYLASAK